MYKWKFGTLNIRSGKEKLEGARIYGITKQIAQENLTFCCLIEVKYRNSGKKIIELNTGQKFNFFWCGQKKRRAAGVGLIIKSERGITTSQPDYQDSRIMGINLNIHGFKIRLVIGYSPTNISGSDSAKDEFYRTMKKVCNNRPKNHKLIVCGDFNAETSLVYDKTEFDGSYVMHQDELCNDNGLRLKSFSRQFKLCMPQTYFIHPLDERYTWYSPDNKTKKVLDYVLTQRFVNQYIKECFVNPHLDFESDHRMIVTEIETPKDKRSRWTVKPVIIPKPDVKRLYEYQNEYLKRASEEIIKRKTENPTAEEISNNLVSSLKTAASEVLPNKTKTCIRQVWKDDQDLNSLLEERALTEKASIAYKKLTKSIKSRIMKLRNDKMRSEADEINNFATKREIERLFKSFKNDGSTFRNIKEGKGCNPQKLTEYFAKHFGPREDKQDPIELQEAPSFVHKLQSIPVNFNILPPEKKEIIDLLRRLKNGKSSNDLQAIYLKAAIESNDVIEELVELYKTVWSTKKIPSNWSHSKLVTIWKGATKGKIDDPSAYRGIQVGSIFSKILVIIILERSRTWYEAQLLDEQQGFRSSRGTTDGLYILKRIQQISNSSKKQLYALFVDLTAAFDHVRRDWLFNSIKQRFPNQENNILIELLESIYSYTTTALSESESSIFEILVGVRQGGPESPTLYNLYMDYVMRIFIQECDKKNIRFIKTRYTIPRTASTSDDNTLGSYGTNLLSWVGYADDIVLVFETNAQLQAGLVTLNHTFKRFGLQINISKTKSMIFNFNKTEEEYPDVICSLEGGKIDNVKMFQYLGSNINFNESLTGDGELNQRIESAESKYYQHAKKLMNHKIHLATRVTIYNALIRSRLTYGCQTWTLNSSQLRRLSSFHCGLLRRMVRGGFKRQDDRMAFKFTNNAILELCKTESIETFIARQQKNFLAHIIRRDDSSLLKQLTFNDDSVRKRGRSTTLRKAVLQRETIDPNTFYNLAIQRKI